MAGLVGAVVSGEAVRRGAQHAARDPAVPAEYDGYSGALGDIDTLAGGPSGLDAPDPSVPVPAPAPGERRILTREQWGAPKVNFEDIDGGGRGLKYLFIHHTDGSAHDPAARLRSIEAYHRGEGYRGIGYSFVVFPDGTVGVGRGWGKVGAHTVARHPDSGEERGLNREGYAIALAGDFDGSRAPQSTIDTVVAMICDGIEEGWLDPGVEIFGHRDANSLVGWQGEPTTCPGDALYAQLGSIREAVGRYVASYQAGQRPDPGIDLGR